jgi:hypothetical protein
MNEAQDGIDKSMKRLVSALTSSTDTFTTPDSVQFSVTRVEQNSYRVIVQNEHEVIRAQTIDVKDIIDKLGFELEQLATIR